jgi:hypothetical protein
MQFPFSKHGLCHQVDWEAVTLISNSYDTNDGWWASLNAIPLRIFFTVEQNIIRSMVIQDGHEIGKGWSRPD